MALAANALVTLDELKAILRGSGTTQDALLEGAINRASDIVQAYLDRRLITPGTAYTEYHTFQAAESNLYLMDWPISEITTVHEDTTRAYGATSLLVVNTDYLVSKPAGKLIRLSSGSLSTWATGFRAVRVVWKPGYAIADVPQRIKDAALHLASILYQEGDRKSWGISGVSDDAGNFTRVSVDHLPSYVKDRLLPERRTEWSSTGERDA